MFKIIVTDLDGTLLNEKRELSKTAINTLNKLKKQGVIICFASGRPLKGMEKFIIESELNRGNNYCITNTGSCIYNLSNYKLIDSQYLDYDDFVIINNFIKGYNVQVAAYSDNYLYSFSKQINEALINDGIILNMPITIIENNDLPEPICRINVMGSKKDIDSAIKSIPKNILENYYTVRNEDFSFEFLNKKSGKGNALIRLLNILKIDKKDIFVIGDKYNDLEMLKVRGYSVAMGQSPSVVKEICDFITLDNINEGFSFAIKNIVFKEEK